MYYLLIDGAQAGPFPIEHLRQGWKDGTLRGDTMFWQDGMAAWQSMETIRTQLEQAGSFTAIGGEPLLQIGGFWRRVGAFLIDVLLLYLVGFGSGFFLFRFYMSLGVAGLLIGIVVATAYFALLNSRLGGGSTLGQRLLGLRVVNEHGALLSLPRSVVRYLILAFPFFLNKAVSAGLVTNLVLVGILMIPVGAGFASLAYLLIFNRGTRQLVHDLLTRTYVVRTTSPAPAQGPRMWRGHAIVVAILCLATVGVACLTPLALRLSIFRETLAVRQAVLATGVVQAATVTGGTAGTVTNSQTNSVRVLTLLVHLKGPPQSSQAIAAQFAALAMNSDPVISSYDRIDVSVSWGYDIGIASGVVTDQYQHTPGEWQAMLPH